MDRSTREVLGQVGLLDLEQVEQLARGQLAVAQRLDDGDAGGVGQRLEDLGLELPKRVLHGDKYIRLIECCARLFDVSARPRRVRRPDSGRVSTGSGIGAATFGHAPLKRWAWISRARASASSNVGHRCCGAEAALEVRPPHQRERLLARARHEEHPARRPHRVRRDPRWRAGRWRRSPSCSAAAGSRSAAGRRADRARRRACRCCRRAAAR